MITFFLKFFRGDEYKKVRVKEFKNMRMNGRYEGSPTLESPNEQGKTFKFTIKVF